MILSTELVSGNFDKKQLKNEFLKRELACRDFLYYVKYIKTDYQFLAQRNGESIHLKMINKIKEVLSGKIKRLMITCPPRLGKTETWTKLLSSFFLGKNPKQKVIIAGYNTNLAISFARETKNIVDTQKYRNVFGDINLKKDKKQSGDWEFEQGGGMFASGVGGTLTGKGGDLIIIDDPVKNKEEADSFIIQERNNKWYESVVKTRLQNEDSIIIIIMTRWSPSDLAGYLLEKERLGGEKWEKLVIPAIDKNGDEIIREGKRSKGFFENLRENTPPSVWFALYQQDPISARNSLLKYSQIRHFSLGDLENIQLENLTKKSFEYGLIIDPAFSTNKKSDDVVIFFCGKHKKDNTLYIFDWFYGTEAPSTSYKAVINFLVFGQENGQNINFISVEDVAINTRQTEFIKNLKLELLKAGQHTHVHHFKPKEKKEDRIKFNLEPILSLGGIFVRNDHPDKIFERKLEEQMSNFPNGRHDDIIDCISQAVDVFNLKYTLPGNNDNNMYNTTNKIVEVEKVETLGDIGFSVL